MSPADGIDGQDSQRLLLFGLTSGPGSPDGHPPAAEGSKEHICLVLSASKARLEVQTQLQGEG